MGKDKDLELMSY